MKDDLRQLATLSETELLREIVNRYDVEPQFYSPDGFRARAREVLKMLMASARAKICGKAAVLESPEVELATQLVSLLQGSLPEQLLGPFALYVARVGVRHMCAEH